MRVPFPSTHAHIPDTGRCAFAAEDRPYAMHSGAPGTGDAARGFWGSFRLISSNSIVDLEKYARANLVIGFDSLPDIATK